jgi:signal transduction histidine kinase
MFLDAGLKLVCVKNPPGNKQMMLCVFRFKTAEPSELIDADTYKLFRLLNDTIINSNRSNDIYSSIQYSIDRICGFTQWEIGHCFLIISGNLFSTKIWNSDFNHADNVFREFSDRINLKTKESMASECIKNRVHFRMKLKDIDTVRFKRIAILSKLGFKTGYWYPLKLKDEITGVLEFFSRREAFCKTGIFEGINNVAFELGSMIYRIRASESARINDKINALGRFSAGIAHEIRNPLTNISALSQLLLEEDFPAETKQHLSFIVENTNIANNIISSLLNYVSADNSHFEINDFRKFIDTIASMTEVRCRAKKIKFSKYIAGDFPRIRYDRVKLESALLNIITNAIESISGKGIVNLEVFPSAAKDALNIFIKDNGEGISPENFDKIFDPFFSTKDTGTGLGLSLAHQTIISHGGTLNINSRQGI